MWSISKGNDNGDVKCRKEKKPNSIQHLCQQLAEQLTSNVELSTEHVECNENRTCNRNEANVYRSQEDNRINAQRSNNNRTNVKKAYGNSRSNMNKPYNEYNIADAHNSDRYKDNINTPYVDNRANPYKSNEKRDKVSTHNNVRGSNTNRLYEDSRHNTNLLSKSTLCDSNQPSMKNSSRPKQKYFTDPVERVPEESLQISHQPRQSEFNTDEQQQSRRRQPAIPRLNALYVYGQDYYVDPVNMRDSQPDRDPQKQQSFHQNKDVERRQSCPTDVPFRDKFRMEGGAMSSAEVGRERKCLVVDRQDGRRLQQDEEQVDEMQTDNILARVEMQRLRSLQCIERHQRALVLEIQQLLKNEQDQYQLRIEIGKQKLAESRRRADTQCSRKPKPQEPKQKPEFRQQSPIVYEQCKPTTTPVCLPCGPPLQSKMRRPLVIPKQSVVEDRSQRHGLPYRGPQAASAEYSTSTEDSSEENQRKPVICPSCSGLNRATDGKPNTRAPPRPDDCGVSGRYKLDNQYRTPAGSNCVPRQSVSVANILPSKFQYNLENGNATGERSDKVKKSMSADDQCRRQRRTFTAPNASRRPYASTLDTIPKYHNNTNDRNTTSSSSSAPCLQTRLFPSNRGSCDARIDRNLYVTNGQQRTAVS